MSNWSLLCTIIGVYNLRLGFSSVPAWEHSLWCGIELHWYCLRQLFSNRQNREGRRHRGLQIRYILGCLNGVAGIGKSFRLDDTQQANSPKALLGAVEEQPSHIHAGNRSDMYHSSRCQSSSSFDRIMAGFGIATSGVSQQTQIHCSTNQTVSIFEHFTQFNPRGAKPT